MKVLRKLGRKKQCILLNISMGKMKELAMFIVSFLYNFLKFVHGLAHIVSKAFSQPAFASSIPSLCKRDQLSNTPLIPLNTIRIYPECFLQQVLKRHSFLKQMKIINFWLGK